MSSLTLYETGEHLTALLDSRDLCETPEQAAECEAEIEQALADLMRKVDDYTRFLAHLESQRSLATTEIERLKTRRQYFLATQQRLEQYAIRTMQEMDVRKLNGETSQLRLHKNPPAVEIIDERRIPEQFWHAVETVSLDKRAIKQAIDNGVDVPGALLRSGMSLLRR